MQYDTHVYLGPTLDISTAIQHLWCAHYHPPIQCGDLIRLLRLKPKRVLIIDGFYESVPAVWHKEIMLLLAHQIPVYGAASMGALRAAELYQYGMKGLGKVFEDFKSGVLHDDDEVAVVHQGQKEQYLPINDAMVNIRATCELAYLEKKLTHEEKDQLIHFCKNQFYPYRSLKQAMKQLDFNNKHDFSEWLSQHGIMDLKKNDAIMALKQIQTLISEEVVEERKTVDLPVTKFIATLIDEIEGTPFSFQESWFPDQENWLPDIENKLYQLSIQNPTDFSLVNKLATLIKHISINIPDTPLSNIETSQAYINQHQLYLPILEINFTEQSSILFKFYTWMFQQICVNQIAKPRIKAYTQTLILYFNLTESNSPKLQSLLEMMVLLVLLSHMQLNDGRLKIKKNIISYHLQESGFWFRYHQQKQHHKINLHTAIDFIAIYMQVTYIYQGFRDTALGQSNIPDYFNWIYDAFIIYEGTKADKYEN